MVSHQYGSKGVLLQSTPKNSYGTPLFHTAVPEKILYYFPDSISPDPFSIHPGTLKKE
jgi:hypothetical protein